MLHSVTEKIGPWINAALDKHGRGENIAWESTLMPAQDGQGAAYTVVMWFPGAVLGSTVQGSFQLVDPLGLTEEETMRIISAFVAQIREARSAQVAQEAPTGPPAAPGPLRGTQRPSGLLIP